MLETIWNSLVDLIEDQTVAAVLLTFIGAMISFLLQNFYLHYLQEKRTVKKLIKKYTKPLTESAVSLDHRVNNLLRNKNERWFHDDKEYRLSTLYKFGVFFSWLHILELETGFMEFGSSKKAKCFDKLKNNIFKISSASVLQDFYDIKDVEDVTIRREIISGIAVAMIDENSEGTHPLAFAKFIDLYYQNPDRFRWYFEIEYYINKVLDDNNTLFTDRLVIFQYHLREFIWFLDKKYIHVLKDNRNYYNLEMISSDELFKLYHKSSENKFRSKDLIKINSRLSSIKA